MNCQHNRRFLIIHISYRWMHTSSIFSSPFSHVVMSFLQTMSRLCQGSHVENSDVALRGYLMRDSFFIATFLLGFKRDDTMAWTRCLVSPSCHLIPSVSLAPFHFSTYLPRSANHISVRRVTCFPVLQQPTLHDALQQIYQIVLTSPQLLRRSWFRSHLTECTVLLARVIRPRSPSRLPTCLDGPDEFETSRARLYLLAQPPHRIASLHSVTILCVKVSVAHVSHIIMLNMKRAQ